MNCEEAAYKISCELQNVAEAIGQPTAWDIAGVVVAGVAALLTAGIAAANVFLLMQQQKFDVERLEARRRIPRRKLAKALEAKAKESLALLVRNPYSLASKTTLGTEEVRALADECEMGDPDSLISLLDNKVQTARRRYGEIDFYTEASEEIQEHLERWVSDPVTALKLLRAEKSEFEANQKIKSKEFLEFLGLSQTDKPNN